MTRGLEAQVREAFARGRTGGAAWSILAAFVSFVVAAGCTTGPSAPVEDETPNGGLGDGAVTTVDRYEGDWTIFYQALDAALGEPDEVSGVCPGWITITIRTSESGLVEFLRGTYVVLAEGDCAAGSTMSGSIIDIDVRQDGGIDFGLEVPGTDGNMFEDFLVGSGFDFGDVKPFGCSDPEGDGAAGEAKDEINHLNGTLIGARLRAAASASMKCPGGQLVVVDEDEGERVAQEVPVQVKISLDLMRVS